LIGLIPAAQSGAPGSSSIPTNRRGAISTNKGAM
jgi:hypothetical protein